MTLFFLEIIYFLRFRNYNEKKLRRQIRHAEKSIVAIGMQYTEYINSINRMNLGIAIDIERRVVDLDRTLIRHEIRLMIAQRILSKL